MDTEQTKAKETGWSTGAGRMVLTVLLGAALIGGGCSNKKGSERPDGEPGARAAGEGTTGMEAEVADDGDESERGLSFDLSEADGDVQSARPEPVEVKPLSESQTEALLARLPAMPERPGDEAEFAFRKRSKPAPKTGETVQTAFPTPADRPKPGQSDEEDQGDKKEDRDGLELVRRAPVGDVDLAARVSATFSKPMVAVTSQQQAARTTPVQLAPEVDGTWRWVGTKTLVLEPADGRLPMATEYKATVRGVAKAADGEAFGEAEVWEFRTPPVRVETWHPTGGPHELKPVMFVGLNQKVEAAEILEHLKLWGGRKTYELTRVPERIARQDERVRQLIERAEPGQWVTFRPVTALPAGTQFQLALREGAPSAEGPLVTEKAQYAKFRTYDSLELSDYECGWRGCRPLQPWSFEFNNPLAEDSVDASMVRVEPELPGKKIEVHGKQLVVRGRSKGRTTYEIRLDEQIEDVFGQTLEDSETVQMTVDSARPALGGPGDMVVLDPAGPAELPVWAVNWASLKVEVWRVEPSDWTQFAQWRRQRPGNGKTKAPGEKVVDETVRIEAKADEFVRHAIDLDEALEEEYGQLVVRVRPGKLMKGATRDDRGRPNVVTSWVQSTDIGLDAYVDSTDLLGWATSLKDGAPLEDVELSMLGGGAKEKTNAKGVATLELPESIDESVQGNALVARKGNDVAVLLESRYSFYGGSNWKREKPGTVLRWYTFDDRQMYRPGESVHVKGWVRKADLAEGGELSFLGEERTVSWQAMGPRGNELADGEAQLSSLGGFHFTVELPDDVNLGQARIQMSVSGDRWKGESTNTYFQIQEFRTPKFEVGVTARPGPHVVGGTLRVTAEADYYAGGALKGAPVDWRVVSKPGDYDPPGWDDFVFGEWQPWWWHGAGGQQTTKSFEGQTNAAGEHGLAVKLREVSPPRPMTLSAEASVQDVTRQVISGQTNVLVHPGKTYVGMQTRRNFVQKGEAIHVKLIATDLEGELEEGRQIEVVAERLDWTWQDGEWQEVVEDTDTCEVASEADPVRCSFETEVGGIYRLTAYVSDSSGRRNRSRMRVWVSGAQRPSSKTVEMEELQLVPDKQSYQPGDTAEVLVQAPFTPAEGLLTLRRGDIAEQRRFEMKEPSKTLKIDIAEEDIPNLEAHVQLVGAAQRQDDKGDLLDQAPRRPAQAAGALNLPVPPRSRELAVDIQPKRRDIQPGDKLQVEVAVDGADGKPVGGSEVALVVVDEAVLALTGYELADPLGAFYPQRGSRVGSYHLRNEVLLADLEALMDQGPGGAVQQSLERFGAASADEAAPMMAKRSAAAPGGGGQTIAMREDFRPLAYFGPRLTTGKDGKATATLEMPDNLTRWRLMAVAVSGEKRFGKDAANVTARLPLAVRPSMPRFLNWGDRAELPLLVHNQTGEDRQVRLAARARNLELTGPRGMQFRVGAGQRVEVRVPATTAEAGRARLQFALASGGWADAAQAEFPVWTPATTEAFATYGTVEEEKTIVQPVDPPEDAVEQFGGLEVSTSSTALQQLTDAFLYLVDYPYECSEQVASRMLGVAALKDVLGAFEAEGLPEEAELKEAMSADIDRLIDLQTSSGGFALWRGNGEVWPYVSVHATYALWKAGQAGYTVPEGVLRRAADYLTKIEKRFPSYYSEKARHTIHAYALFVLEKLGRGQPAEARALAGESLGDTLSFEAAGWVSMALGGGPAAKKVRAELWRQLNNRVRETAAAAHFATSYRRDQGYLVMASNRRADAILLEALIAENPKSDLIPKIARGLLAHRSKGRWSNTQENVFVLLGLERYFEVFEKQTPDFVARMWLGDGYMGEHAYEGRTTERKQVEVPMKVLGEQVAKQGEEAEGGETVDLTLQKQGKGRLYYRIGLRYAPESLELPPADYGFAVERSYEAVDDPKDVRQKQDGTWVVRAGARVRVRLSMFAPTRRYHVALVDPLAAGFEPLNPALKTTGSIPQDPKDQEKSRYWWWSRPWYEHQNLRDERAEAFASLLWEGVHTYSYVVRATTPGEFVVPPAKAEEMYHPETFGRTGTAKVVIQ